MNTRFESLWSYAGGTAAEAVNHRGNGFSEMRLCKFTEREIPELDAGTYFLKRQKNYQFRTWLVCQRPTLLREKRGMESLADLSTMFVTPEVVYYSQELASKRAILLTRPLQGFLDLQTVWQQQPGGARKKWILQTLAQGLIDMHGSRLCHGALYPRHVFVADSQLALIDFEKSRRMPFARSAALRDVARFLRHAEFLDQGEMDTLTSPFEERFSGFTRQLALYQARKHQ